LVERNWFLGEVDVMLPLEAVLCHSQLSKVDMLVVFFHPVLDRLATLPSVDRNTCTGDVVHTQSSHVFQAILNRTKEAGDLPPLMADQHN
jgi:hypothetical protein